MKTSICLFIALMSLMVGCVSANVSDDSICTTKSLGSIPYTTLASHALTLPPQTFMTPVDFSDTVKKVSDVADSLTVNVNQLSLTSINDLSWLTQVDISVAGDSPDTPMAVLASYRGNGSSGNTVNTDVKMDGATLLRYVSHPLTLTFTVDGSMPQKPVTFSTTMCLAVGGHVSKSL